MGFPLAALNIVADSTGHYRALAAEIFYFLLCTTVLTAVKSLYSKSHGVRKIF